MAATKRKTSSKPKVSREQLLQQKAALGEQLEQVYMQVMRFCTGAPPKTVVNGSYQLALVYKDLVAKTRNLVLNKSGSPNQLQARINRFHERLLKFKKFA